MIWIRVKEYFSDFVTISFVEVDVSKCPDVLVDFPEKKLPAYSMMSDNATLGLLNMPDTFEKVKNFFFDYAYKSYKRQKNFTTFSNDQGETVYPVFKSEMVFDVNHDEKIKAGNSYVL
jgi:hypothetical protein